MTNLELQELLKQYPDDLLIFIPSIGQEYDFSECIIASIERTCLYDDCEDEEGRIFDCIQLDYE